MKDFSTGSTWGKWDLHIHSNASDGEGTPKEIIAKAKEMGLSVIALTDHHTAKNIDEIKQEGLKENITVISGIEFRTEYGSKSVHMIGLFPEIHKTTTLNSRASHDLILSPLNLSETKIIAKGKESDGTISDEAAFHAGMFLVQVSFKEAADKIHEYGGLVIVHAGSKVNSIDNEMKHVGTSLKNATSLYDSLGTVKEELFNENYIDICEIRKEGDSEEFYFNKFNKVSIIGSDAHSNKDIGSKFVWIKANPTFEGLKQASRENSRIFIGDIPPLKKRVSENPQRYIKKITFTKKEKPTLPESWFENIELELNPGLVAIIGNKGMGKSALADTIGLLGDTPNHKDFSFLNETKFRKPKPNRSESYSATLHWESNLLPETKTLSDNPEQHTIEKVKYLPQGYLETLCNDNHDNFLNELRNVIFTYIPFEKRLGKTSLEDLEKFTADSIESEIQQIINDIKDINEGIVELEKKESESYKSSLQSILEQKKIDLDAHKQTRPADVPAPNQSEVLQKNQEITQKIDEHKQNIIKLEATLSGIKQQQSATLLSKANLESVQGALTVFENESVKTKGKISQILLENGININDVIELKINREEISNSIEQKNSALEKFNKQISNEEVDNIPEQIREFKNQLIKLNDSLDGPSRIYQKFLVEKEAWEKAEKTLMGNIDQPNSIRYIENELEYISSRLGEDIIAVLDERKTLVKKLFDKKAEILNSFKVFYQPITDFFVNDEKKLLQSYEIKLDIENRLTGFEDKFLSQINAGSKGSFHGTEDGRRVLLSILRDSKWMTKEDTIIFLDTIIEHLKIDKRTNNGDKRDVDKQLKSGYTVEELYNFIFSLEYLEPTYKLKLNEKNIEELSPGERGALLLIFYLALDRNDIPLVIDQPEENLDNQSVYNLLAQYIIRAKEKRQVIIVTHNPNLAVVCDADQIVHVKTEKHNHNKVIIKSGALENPEINNVVVDILEGTYNAFDIRDMKYKVIPRPLKK